MLNFFKKIWYKIKKPDISRPPILTKSEIEIKIHDYVVRNISKFQNLVEFNCRDSYWASVVLAICSAESGFNRFDRYYESTMGYYSEGLMQLSYEDCPVYNFPLDKSKNEIFEIEKNIELGLIILDRLVKSHGHYIFNSGNYWAVLQPKNKRHIEFIKAFEKYKLF